MSRLPIPGQDKGTWGDILNDYLGQSLAADGTLQPNSVGLTQLASSVQTSLGKADSSVQTINARTPTAGNVTLTSADVTDATTTGKAVLTAVDAPTARTAIGAGTSNLAIGTTSTTAAAGNDSRILNAADAQTAMTFSSTSGVIALDCSLAYVWSGTVTGSFSFNLINVPTSGTVVELLVKITQDNTGSRSFTGWAVNGSTVTPTWDTGTAPTVSQTANTTTILNLMTLDGGATLLGQGLVPKLDVNAADYQAIGTATTAGSTGLAADAGHTHLGVTQIVAGTNVTVSGGDSNGHGVLTVSAASASAVRDGNFAPTDQGLIAWSYDVMFVASNSTINTGVLFLVHLHIPTSTTVTNIICGVNTAGAALTASQNIAGLYSVSGSTATLMSGTTDQSSVWTSSGMKTMALGSSQSVSPGEYYVGYLVNGTTSPSFIRATAVGLGSTVPNVGAAANRLRQGIYGGGLTSLPSSFATTSMTVIGTVPWTAVS